LTLGQLLASLEQRGVELRLEGEALRSRGPRGAIDAELREAIGVHRAALVEHLRGAVPHTPPPLERRERGPRPPLSYAQQRLWFMEQLQPGTAVYNLPAAFRLRGPLDVRALALALRAIVQRHESLRTTISQVAGQPYQRVEERVRLELPVIDFSHFADREVWAIRERAELAGLSEQPFDLERGPLVRAALIRFSEEEHTLFFMAHHIIWDGWSFDVWLAELDSLYQAHGEGIQPAAAEPAVQYADFALWQREWLEGGELERQLRYWRRQLGSGIPALDLPTDRPRPAVMSYRGATLQTTFGRALTERLRELGREENATLYMVLLAALFTLLHRYSSQEDLSIGCPIAGTAHPELERSIGFFVNTLVLRGDLSGRPTFRALLRRVRDVCVDAYSHKDVPFERLVEDLKPERDRSRSPLYQVLFTYQDATRRPAQIGDLALEQIALMNGTVATDLCFWIKETRSELPLVLDYNTDLFDRTTIERMLGHLHVLLHGIASGPDRELGQLPLLGSREREQVLHSWNQTEVEWSDDACVHELVARQAAQAPDAVAVRCGDEALTHRELEERANRLAHALRTLGIGTGARVGICVERSVDLVVGLLGILKAGAAYVPLDPTYPQERLAYMVQDSRAGVIVAHASFEWMFAGSGAKVIALDRERAELAALPSVGAPAVAACELAYVIYTSGSTGLPKGVMVEHRNVVNLLRALREPLALEVGARFLSSTSISFDISVLEIFGSLAFGAELTLSEQPGRDAPLAQLIERCAATHFQCTPSQLAIWIADARARRAIGTLRTLCVGGEELPAPLAAELSDVLPGRVFNVYGPTETTIWSCAHRLLPAEVPPRIGRPLANTRVYVLDEALNPTPIGVIGELYIGGAGVARGYFGRPDLDAERFLADPFAPGTGRMYRTGDRMRLRGDGTLEFFGRRDGQIKLRGYRIELGEIEARLAAHPAVREAAARVHEWAGGDRRLVGYVVPSGEQIPSAEMLREHLRATLPDFMVPALYVTLRALPQTPNGKLDRKALPAPEIAGAGGVSYVEPADADERRMAELWSGVLRVPRVGALDDFFDLGGHSLLAVRLVDAVRREFAVPLSLAAFFEARTLRAFTQRMRDASRADDKGEERWTTLVPVQPHGRRPPLYCAAGGGGNPMNLRHLARHLGGDQPFFGLQFRGVDGVHRPHESIEAMAEEHVRDIRRHQPEGPYFVGGYSGGGLVSLEIARQLREAGSEVALLVLLDANNPQFEGWSSGERLERHVGRLREFGVRYVAERAWGRALRSLRWAQTSAAALLARAFPFRFRRAALLRAFLGAIRRYEIRPYEGAVLLLQAKAPLQGRGIGMAFDPYNGWKDAVKGEIEVIVVPGNHNSFVMEPHAGTLAEKLRGALDRARGAARSRRGPS
jgi:amino acid adenylation domain-containing protein